MNIDYQQFIPKKLSKNTRVWIYQSDRQFTSIEKQQIEEQLTLFSKGWQSHGSKVDAFCILLFDYFLVFMADEADMNVSGCSIDSTVRLIKSFESEYNVSLFNRISIALLIDNNVTLKPLNEVNSELKAGILSPNTLLFDNTVQDLPSFLNNWMIPIGQSWIGKRLNVNIVK